MQVFQKEMPEGMRLEGLFIQFPVQGQSLQLPDGREIGASISQPAPKILIRIFGDLREETPLLPFPILEAQGEAKPESMRREVKPDPVTRLFISEVGL